MEPATPGTVPPEDRDALVAHLNDRYGVQVEGLDTLDQRVFRVRLRDGRSWVARVFPDRTEQDVENDAAVLAALGRAGFPAERCATEDPVSRYGASPVLVTGWVDGVRADGRGRTFGVLGALLGRLHERTATGLNWAPDGGAWHHLSPRGGPRAEIDGAIRLLEEGRSLVRRGEHHEFDRLLETLDDLDDGRDLPQALVHPDYVPVNAVTTPDDRRVLVDWGGAGRGPRIWPLAFLLWAAAVRDHRLVDAALTRYLRHVRLEPAEIERLADVVPVRPLTLDVWGLCRGRTTPAEVLRHLDRNRDLGGRLTDRVAALTS